MSKRMPLTPMFDRDLFFSDRKCISDTILLPNFERQFLKEHKPSDKSKSVVSLAKVSTLTVYMV
jgi:hypothetical protein